MWCVRILSYCLILFVLSPQLHFLLPEVIEIFCGIKAFFQGVSFAFLGRDARVSPLLLVLFLCFSRAANSLFFTFSLVSKFFSVAPVYAVLIHFQDLSRVHLELYQSWLEFTLFLFSDFTLLKRLFSFCTLILSTSRSCVFASFNLWHSSLKVVFSSSIIASVFSPRAIEYFLTKVSESPKERRFWTIILVLPPNKSCQTMSPISDFPFTFSNLIKVHLEVSIFY